MKKFKKFFLIVTFASFFGLICFFTVWAQDYQNTADVDEFQLIKGDLGTLTVHSLTRLSITDPDIADVVKADENEVLLVGNSAGQTALFIWDEMGKRTVMIEVFNRNLDLVKNRIEKLLKGESITEAKLEVNERESKIVVTGDIPEYKQGQFDKILDNFGDDVWNLTKKEEIENLVEVNMQVTELSTTLTKSLGIEWSGVGPTYTETLPNFDGSISDFFKIGDFRRTTSILAQVKALLEEGKGRILSRPKLVVVSGDEASFLVGGEIPIRTSSTSSSGTTTENVSFKSYGIGMTIKPTIKKGKIDITLMTDIRDIDQANKVGDNVAFSTRTAQTRLFLDDNQTIVLAGLIKKSEGEIVKKVPFLGSVPIVGALFRSRSTPAANQETELVISLTPRIMSSAKEGAVAPQPKASSQEKTISVAGSEAGAEKNISAKETSDSSTSMVPFEMSDYIKRIQEKILQATTYPEEAKQYGWEGTVKLGLLILNDGTLAVASVKKSSGYDIFDEYALNTAKRIAPYEQFPSDSKVQELNITIPIVYSLKRN